MKYKIGLDIGASKILGIIWNNKKIIYSVKIETPKNRKVFLDNVFGLLAVLIDLAGKDNVSDIGIAVAGVLDKNGKITVSPNMNFLNGLNLKNLVKAKFKKPTAVINDARAFLLYELKFGVARRYKNVLVLTLGSGIGGGFSIDGKPVFGSRGGAGEIGHIIIQIKIQNSKVKSLSLEDLASVKNINSGYSKMGEYLGIGLANLVNAIDPEIIVIGGGLASTGDKILNSAKKTMKKYILSHQAKNTPVIIEKKYEIASAIGTTLI